MLNPLSALLVGRQLVKEGGYFLVESAYAPGGVCVGSPDETMGAFFDDRCQDRARVGKARAEKLPRRDGFQSRR